MAVANPALEKFVAQLGHELVLAQVLIRRRSPDYELRHMDDRDRPEAELQPIAFTGLRALAQFTADGAFRPLKSAPNLQTGWRATTANDVELERALNQLYPGAVADWFAVQSDPPPVTNFREFTRRQTGMYRITQKLTDAQAALVIRAGCHRSFCWKRRLWSVAGLAPDAPGEKSLIPCLEPCALLLEFARAAMRNEQADKLPLPLSPQEAATLRAALEALAGAPQRPSREGDFGAAENPRRAQLLLEKLHPLLQPARDDTEAETEEG